MAYIPDLSTVYAQPAGSHLKQHGGLVINVEKG
jgi:hypothetical protein